MDETARAVTEERQRIAARLHDGPVQQLTAAQLFLETALMQQEGSDVRPMLERATDAMRGAVEECRALMRELAGDAEGP